jgi:hypothetical protein
MIAIAYGGKLALNRREARLELNQTDGILLGGWVAHRDFISGLTAKICGAASARRI